MKVSKNFSLKEFVCEKTWEKYGEKALWFIDPRIISSAQTLRDILRVPLTINSWANGGNRQESGLRIPEHKNYNPKSQHTFGRAVDIITGAYTAESLRKHILENQFLYPHIKAMELKVDWLHIDCRNTNQEEILLFNP